MKSSVTTLEDNKVKVSVDIDETEIDQALDVAFKKLAKQVRIPGFRPGKAPRRVLEAQIGKEYARGEALNDAIPEYYRQAIIEHDVDVISPPDLDVVDGRESGPVTVEAIVEVRPVVTVAGYNGLRIEIPGPTAPADEIEAQLEALRNQFSEREEVEREAAEGDFVVVDIVGSQDGEPVEGLTAEDYTYEVGSGFIVEGMDENMVGAKAGDTVTFEGNHPNEEDTTLSFEVNVKKVEQKVLPELTDEFVTEATEFKTVDELTADTRKRIEQMRKQQAQAAIADKTGEALAQLVEIDVPESLVQEQVQRQLQDMAMRMAQSGMQIEQFLQATGQTIADLAENMKEPAAEAAKVDLALRAVAIAEGMEVTDDELKAEVELTATQVGQSAETLMASLIENGQLSGLKADMAKQKAMEMLIESVEIVDEEGKVIDRADLVPDEPDEPEEIEADEVSAAAADKSDDTGNTNDAASVADESTSDDDGDAAEGDEAE